MQSISQKTTNFADLHIAFPVTCNVVHGQKIFFVFQKNNIPKTVETQESDISLYSAGLVFIFCPCLESNCWAIYAKYLIYNHRVLIVSLA
jgi:hypothetical protein